MFNKNKEMITEYRPTKKYQIGTLKPYVLLLPSDDTFINYSVDNGECNVVSIKASTVIKIEGIGTTYSSEETLEGRFKFSNTLTINISESNGNTHLSEISQLLKGNYYTIFETKGGTFFMQSVDFPVGMSYSYTFSNQNTSANICALSMKSSSNIPTMIIDKENVPDYTQTLISNKCSYTLGKVISFKMCNYNNVLLVQNNNGVFTEIKTNGNQSFNDIVFDTNSFSYTENYEDNIFTQTLTFTIPLDEYKYYWHYNLIEFTNNRYVTMFSTENGNVIIGGFEYGFTPTFTIQSAESDTDIDTITITLKHRGNIISVSNTEGNYIQEEDKTTLLAPSLKYVEENGIEISTVTCLNETTGVYTLFEVITNTGASTGQYYCLEGYQETYKNLNIIGTYSLNDDIGHPIKFQSTQCASQQGCRFFKTPPTNVNFTTYGEKYSYIINGECDWRLEGVPSWLTILPYEGHANTDVEVTMTTTAQPTSDGQTAVVKIVGGDGNYASFIVNYGSKAEWIEPLTFDITAQYQYVSCNLPNYYNYKPVSVVRGTFGYAGYNIIGEELRIIVEENESYDDPRTITCIVKNGQNETVNVTINQDKLYKGLITVDGFICDGNTSYKKMEIYKGYTPDDIKIATGTYEKGELILENDTRCSMMLEEWRATDETLCSGSNEYVKEVQYISYNGGTDWSATGETRMGKLLETNSPKCDSRYQWVNNGNTLCINGNLYQQLAKTYTEEGGQPVYTGETKVGNLIESQSSECVGVEETLISFTYTNRNYQMNTDEAVCKIYANSQFTVNYGNGDTDNILSGQAIQGIDIVKNWGYSSPREHTIQIYGKITEIYIKSPGVISGLNVDKGGVIRNIVINPPMENGDYAATVSISEFNLKGCSNLQSLVVYKHTGADGINSFIYPDGGNLREITVHNNDTDECYISPQQLQSIIDNAVSVAGDNNVGIMSFCDCLYIEKQTGERKHIACEVDSSSLETKKWLFNTPCCETEGKKKYQLIELDGETVCDTTSFNKLQLMKVEESTYTEGNWSDWTDTGYRVTGDVVEYNSKDCGYIPQVMEEWRLNTDYYICAGDDNEDSYYANIKYISTDGGTTWTIKQPIEMENSGQIRKTDDPDCGWLPPGTYRERWVVIPDEYICLEGEGEFNPCGFYMLWTPFGFKDGKFNGINSTATALPEICDGDQFTSIDGMFKDMQLLQLLPVFDTVNVNSAKEAFMNCTSLESTEDYPLSQYTFTSLKNATSMFENCASLTDVKINLPSATTIDRLFYACTLSSIEFLSCGNISSLKNWMGYTNNLKSIKGLNVGGFTGECDARGGNEYTRGITTLYVYNINCRFRVDAFPSIGKDSVEYIIQHCIPHANAVLVFTNEQFTQRVTKDMVTYMTNYGIKWEIAS